MHNSFVNFFEFKINIKNMILVIVRTMRHSYQFILQGLVNHSISDFGLAKMTFPGLQDLWFLSDGALIIRASIMALKTDVDVDYWILLLSLIAAFACSVRGG